MASYDVLDVKEEEELYRTRLLNVEEKPFKRITKRLGTLHKVVAASVAQEQTPPPEATSEEEPSASQARLHELAQLREDVTLDFAAFDASVARLQFLYTANDRERTRYAADRGSILDTCQDVRDNMVVLRAQLEQARATLAQRKTFDDMADRITQSKTLRPRPDQQATILKLEEECRQLQRESATYTETWRERKEQFARIMDESMRLRRLIRDEKEEVERREGMDDEEGGGHGPGGQAGGHGGSVGGGTAAGTRAGTPGPAGAGAATAGTSAANSRGRTPVAHDSQAQEGVGGDGGLRPSAAAAGTASRGGSRAVSREVTPAPAVGGGDDVEMSGSNDSGAQSGPAATPAAGTPAPVAGGEDGEKMDTT